MRRRGEVVVIVAVIGEDESPDVVGVKDGVIACKDGVKGLVGPSITFALYSLLTSLRFWVEAARSNDPRFNHVEMLGTQNRPLDQFKDF